METLTAEEARDALIELQASFELDYSGITETNKTITHLGHTVNLEIIKPEGQIGMTPVFMFIHGGGWILGDYPSHRRMVRDLVVLSGYTGVFVNYTRSPEAKYPQAVHEVYAVSQWFAEYGSEIGVQGDKLGIVGNSAGGNLATASALMANANHGKQYKLQILMWPVTNADFNNSSWIQFGQDRFLTAPLMKWMWDQYILKELRTEIYASHCEPQWLKCRTFHQH